MILVTGATGNIGGQVAQKLIAKGAKVRVLSRDPAKAKALYSSNVEIAQGDLTKPESLPAALKGVERVFLVSVGPMLAQQDANLANAAKAAGVKHIVKLSTLGLSSSDRLIRQWHAAGEKAIQDSGLAWTFVRPGAFMTNARQWVGTIRAKGEVYSATGDGKIAPIHPSDIADVAVVALTESGHEGKSYELTGGEALSWNEQVQILSDAIGKPVKHVDVGDEGLRAGLKAANLPEALIQGLAALQKDVREGRTVVSSDDVEKLLGRKPRTWKQWCEENAASFR